jgi:O-antigen/teichoic acid export membrane protein
LPNKSTAVLGLYKSLFKQTAIYGLATVLPRMFSFLLVPLYTKIMPADEYGAVTVIFAYIMFFNVILAYGMETAFFRFYSKEDDKAKVLSTSTISVFWSSIGFLILGLLFRKTLAGWVEVVPEYVTYGIWILVLDALVIIPFSRLRAFQRPMVYSSVKIANVAVNMGLNLFFLIYLPKFAAMYPNTFIDSFYIRDFQIGYIFLSNLIASLLTFGYFLRQYFKISWQFDATLWKKMMRYGFPVLIAGIAFAVNEHLDKILLDHLLPDNVAKAEVGAYAACYKLGLFMVLFATAFRLGIEPFFFSHSGHENAKQTYAVITKYFVIFGSFILLSVIVFADLLKKFMLPNPEYWNAMKVVPLIILANFFLGIYNNLSVWYKLTDKTKIGAYISIVGAVLTLILNFTLIPIFEKSGHDGYMGSAIATISAYGSMMIISWYFGNKYYPIPYDMKKIFGYLGVSIIFSVISFYWFREKYYVGIPLLMMFMYFIYHNEKETLNRIIKRPGS